MVMKGTVQSAHIPINNYELIVVGLPPIVFTKITGLEVETEKTDLPDRTVASGGNEKPSEIVGTTMQHHTVELAALELWRKQGVDPVDPLYKKVGTLIQRDITGKIRLSRSLVGIWITKRKDADLDMEDEGKPATCDWTFSIDQVLPI